MANKNRKNVQEYAQERDNDKSQKSQVSQGSTRGTRDAKQGSRDSYYGSEKSGATNGWDASKKGAEPRGNEPIVGSWDKRNHGN